MSFGLSRLKLKLALRKAWPADGSARNEVGDDARLRVVAVHERLHQDEPSAFCLAERLVHVGRATRIRLLDEHVLADVQGMHGRVVMEIVRERDVDGVDVRVLE